MQKASIANDPDDDRLGSDEIWWRDRGQMLLKHGYRLRPRLQPGWTPSWLSSGKKRNWCEDGLRTRLATKVVDAVRISDNKDVAISKLEREGDEAEILRYVTDPKQTGHKNHHIVPVLDSFEDESEPDLIFFVAPLLRHFNYPDFEVVSDIAQLFEQLLEGLIYLHSIGVAHRDCSFGNIMMDAPSLFPKGFHPCHIARDRTGETRLKRKSRHKVFGPINYYFIDFDISIMYEPGEERVAYGNDGADRDVPEFSSRGGYGGYDPFPADVFILGNFFKKHIIPDYPNLDFLTPLTSSMTALKPSDRPTAEEALLRLKEIISMQGFFSFRRRLFEDDEKPSSVSNMFENVGIVWRTGLFAIGSAGHKGISCCSRSVRTVRGLVRSPFSKKSK